MPLQSAFDGDRLLPLLGSAAESPPVQGALAQLARGMQPELDPDDETSFVDWVTVNEIGLEFGFEDEAYVRALDPEQRRQGSLLLTQVYFYGDTPKTRPFPYRLPFDLEFTDDRAAVRHKLARVEALRRSYVRDAWKLDKFNLTIAYDREQGILESVLCALRYQPWPALPLEEELVASFTPVEICELFGARWSSALLRSRLAPLGYANALGDVRNEQTADLRLSHGVEFGFAPARQVAVADQRSPAALVLASVTFYGPRVFDSHQWVGPMPHDLSFADSQAQIAGKIGRRPDDRGDSDRAGFVVWHFERYTLRAEYSNVENTLLRATMMAPGYWDASTGG